MSERAINERTMNKCDNCGVLVHAQHAKCPLCQKGIAEAGESATAYPHYEDSYFQIKYFTTSRLFTFIALVVIIVCVTTNLLTLPFNSTPWSAIISVTVLYVWFTVRNTVMAKIHIGSKVLLQFLALSLFLFVLDFCSQFTRWSTNYAIPFLTVATTLGLTVVVLTKKSLWNEYMGYLLVTFCISLCPILLFLVRLSNTLWTGVGAIVYALLTIIGMLLFTNKKFKEELKKRFHS